MVEAHKAARLKHLMRDELPEEGARLARALGVDPQALVEAGRTLASEMELVTIPVREISPEVLDELNACILTSGRIGSLVERLQTMRAYPAAR